MKLPNISFDVGRDDLQVTLTGLENVDIQPSKPEWDEYEQEVFKRIRSSITLDDIRDEPILRSYRDLYWTFGMDPTKLRVSSEALLRRVLNDLNLWRVSNLVDVINLASAYHKIPIGLTDAKTVVGDLQVRVAKKGEVFQRIGGKAITCRGREIVLADEEKIVCFGYATHDSDLTKVSKNSRQVYVLLYASDVVPEAYLESSTNDTNQMIREWVDCSISGLQFFRAADQ